MYITVNKQKLIDTLRKESDDSFTEGLRSAGGILDNGKFEIKNTGGLLNIKINHTIATGYDPTPEDIVESLTEMEATPTYDKLLELGRLVDETDNVSLSIDYNEHWSVMLVDSSESIHYNTIMTDLIAAVNNAINYIKTNRVTITPSDKDYYLM